MPSDDNKNSFSTVCIIFLHVFHSMKIVGRGRKLIFSSNLLYNFVFNLLYSFFQTTFLGKSFDFLKKFFSAVLPMLRGG